MRQHSHGGHGGPVADWNIPAFQELISLDTLYATDSILTYDTAAA
jgi:hypothetical protein